MDRYHNHDYSPIKTEKHGLFVRTARTQKCDIFMRTAIMIAILIKTQK